MNSCIFHSWIAITKSCDAEVRIQLYVASQDADLSSANSKQERARSTFTETCRIGGTPVTPAIDTMIRLLRMANIAMLFLYSLGLIIRVPQEIMRLSKEGSVPLIAFLVVTLLLLILHALSLYYAWRGLGSTGTLKVVQIAWSLNIVLALFSLYQIVSSLLGKTNVLLSNPLFTLLVVLNVVALGRRRSMLKAMPAMQAGGASENG